MTPPLRIVVVGGVAAGMSAASQARRRDPRCEVVVLQRERDISYSACGMPYNIGDAQRDLGDLVILDTAAARATRGIDVRVRQQATAIDTTARQLQVRDLDQGTSYALPWDRLVIATGASAVLPPLPGMNLPGVHALRSLEDARQIKRLVGRTPVRRAVVIGAGYIGMEMADVLHQLGIEVTVVEKLGQVLPGFAPAVVALAGQELARQGIQVATGTALQAIEADGADLLVHAGAQTYRAQLVIVAIGVRPNVELARAAGIELGQTGAIATDEAMRTSAENIYAAGDCAEAWHLVLRRPAWIALGTTANKQGKVAGANAAGADERFPGIVGTAGFKLFDLEVARTGLGEAEIERHGLDAVRSVSQHHSRARNYPGDAPITTVVYAERPGGRLLGAQMIGAGTVAKRIDVFATALHAGMTLAQIEDLDLSYAPPFAPVYDPILIAAGVGRKALAPARS
jgi:NADPH-dependent 2,4-dienoyl-CoA reductase/sulfur reductase-like enzyme